MAPSCCKRLGIIDADLIDNGTRQPNLACMKLSAYYKKEGWDVELLENYDALEQYDHVAISRVFTFTKIPPTIFKDGLNHADDGHPELYLHDNIEVGGTGFYFDKAPDLPDEIEHIMPDYHLYDDYIQKKLDSGEPRRRYSCYLDFSIGFTTRGCFRKCQFCVNRKYDHVKLHSPVLEFLESKRPNIYLYDDNFMASRDFDKILDELIQTGKRFQFRQGLDIRLMTDHKAQRLSSVRYYDDYIFAFDHLEDKERIERGLGIWKKYCDKKTKLYVLTGYDSHDEKDISDTFERIKIIMSYGCIPYIMRYEDYKKSKYRDMYIQMARWCNQPAFVTKQSFRQFCENNERYEHSKNKIGQEKHCRCYRTMLDFEKEHPDIAKKYFDMRMEDLNRYS